MTPQPLPDRAPQPAEPDESGVRLRPTESLGLPPPFAPPPRELLDFDLLAEEVPPPEELEGDVQLIPPVPEGPPSELPPALVHAPVDTRRVMLAAAATVVAVAATALVAALAVMLHEPAGPEPPTGPILAPPAVEAVEPLPVPPIPVETAVPAEEMPVAEGQAAPLRPPTMMPPRPQAATAVEAPVAAEVSAAAAALPDQPDRAVVRGALDALQPTMRACAEGSAGVATVTVTFAASGRVTTARVTGPVVGAQGSCIARAVRQARVPPFSQPFVTVSYPVQL